VLLSCHDVINKSICNNCGSSSCAWRFPSEYACFVYCGKARATTTHESQLPRHSEALACERHTTAWYST